METGFSEVFGIGSLAILTGIVVLILMVQRELGPFSGLGKPGRWLLTGAFGMGIFAFSLKMAVALVVTNLPQASVDRLVAAYPQRPLAVANDQEVIAVGLKLPGNPHYLWQPLPKVAPQPANNPSSPAKVALGKRLFNDKRLSQDGTLACASCHELYAGAGGDRRSTAKGIAGQIGGRNTPTVWNAAFQSVLFWDGRAPSLEEQAKGPILNPLEMGLSSATEAERRLAADVSYREQFAAAFGDEAPISFERVAQAIAAYERTLITPDAPYDRFVRGDSSALTPQQLRGMALFESVGCVVCHKGPNFSDAALVGGESPFRFFPANPSRYEKIYPLLKENGERGVWRVASLRNVALTGPWLHNGSVDKLEEVVRIMATAQLGHSAELIGWVDGGQARRVDRAPLSDAQVADIVAFLKALSSERLLAARKE